MATIRTAIQIQDGMSSVFKSMNTVMNIVLNTFESIQTTASKPIDTSSIQAAREELSRAQVVAAQFQNQLSELSSTPVNTGMVNTPSQTTSQNMYNETIGRNQTRDNLVSSITSQQQYNQLLENTRNKLEEMRQVATDISNITGEDKNLLMANNSEYQKMAQMQSILLQNEKEIQNNIANQMPKWETPNTMPVFTNTGIERYKQEIQSANGMINQLSQSQLRIQNQAQGINLLPSNAISDINALNDRIERIKISLQQAQKQKTSGIGADKASNQVETLRRQLMEAIDSQNELTRAMNRMDIHETNIAYNKLVNNIETAEKSIRDNISSQNQFNSSINNGVNSADGLLSKIKQIAIAVGGIIGLKKVFDLSDEMATTTARLNLIVDDNGSVENLENKIFASAMRSRASYQDTADMVSKLGSQAKGAFKNNDELIAFAEQLNKNFVLAGTNQQGIASAQLQITQALASGVLRGEELNAVFENATPVIQKIADYLDVDIGKIRSMAAEGKLSAEVVKNALLASANETNAAFEKMPMTWGQIVTKIKNIALKAFQPVLNKINQFANNPEIQEAFQSFINVVSIAAQAVLGLIEGMVWLYNVLEPFAPVILGIVAAYVAFNLISGLVSIALGVMSAMETIHSAAAMMAAGATLAETAAQWGLNSALYACPIVWVVALILALIVALTYLWFTNDDVAYGILYLWDALRLGIMVAGLGIQAVWYGLQLAALYLWLGIQTVVLGLMTAWYGFQTGVEAVCLGVLSIFQGLYNRNSINS